MTKKEKQKKVLKGYPKIVQKYSKELGELPVLTVEEEKELAKEIEKEDIEEKKRGNDEAKKKLARANLKLVAEIAKYYAAARTKNLSFLDLIQEGNLGLFRAVELYDWRSDYRFSTFASLVIRSAILRVIEEFGKLAKENKIPKERGVVGEIPANLDEFKIEIPLYRNKKGERVTWEELTKEEKREEKKKRRKTWIQASEIKENMSEIINLLSKVTNVSKTGARKEVKKILKEIQ